METLVSNGSPYLDLVVAAMLGRLDDYLPVPAPPLPAPSVSVASVRERAVGLGNCRGMESRGSFAVVELKGIRLDALARFQLWASGPAEADTAITDLNARLMADRDNLQVQGFLRIALESTLPADPVPPPVSAWRKHADYRVLYEHHYTDTDGAESLIARIPVGIDSNLEEATTITDEMVRWDNQDAAALVVRGRFSVGDLSALAFVPGTAPSGTVTLMRTFDGAAGPPTTHATLAAFLAAVAGPNAPERHAHATFAGMREREKSRDAWLGKLASCGYCLAFDFDGQGLSVERSSGIWDRQASPPSP
jgi:hypothetical protein